MKGWLLIMRATMNKNVMKVCAILALWLLFVNLQWKGSLLTSNEKFVHRIQNGFLTHDNINFTKSLKPSKTKKGIDMTYNFQLDLKHPNVTSFQLVIGIPTVRRSKKQYLNDTLKNFLSNLNSVEKNFCKLVIFIADERKKQVQAIEQEVKGLFPNETKSGLIMVWKPPDNFYPNDWSLLFKPSQLGVDKKLPGYLKWRTKQNMDYAYMMTRAAQEFPNSYYMQMEDDLKSKPHFAQTIKDVVNKKADDDWILMEFCTLGFIAKLFKVKEAFKFAQFLNLLYGDWPCDWLIRIYLRARVCGTNLNGKRCDSAISQKYYQHKPSLFQHLGKYSSRSPETIRKIVDRNFR